MPIERKLAAIMFTDIAGYTAQMSKDEDKAFALIQKKRDLLLPLVEKYEGKLIKEMGDGTLTRYFKADNAIDCATSFQAKTDKNLNVRAGIHTGEVIVDKEDVFGDVVNVASRLESIAAPGSILVSKETIDKLENSDKVELVSLGMQSLKGIGRLIEVYAIKDDSLVVPSPDDYKENNINVHSDDEVPSIAIIPFKNKGEKEDEFYTFSISTDLIADVSSAGLLRVASLKDIETLNYKSLSNKELSKKLFVRYIAQGTLWKKDDMFQLSIELYDAKNKKVIWSDRWQEKWENLPAFKFNLSDGLLKALDIKPKVVRKVETTNTKAYEYYLIAKYKYDKRENMEDTEVARGLLKKAIELDETLLLAKNQMGVSYKESSDYNKAIEIFKDNLKQAEELGDKYIIGASLNNLGNIYVLMGKVEKALNFHKRSMKIKVESGEMESLGSGLANIGYVYYIKGNNNKALDYYKRSLKIRQKIDDKHGMGSNLSLIGAISLKKGDYDKALDYFMDSLEKRQKIMDKYGMGYTLNNIGVLYNYKGEYDTALDYHLRSLKIDCDIKNKRAMMFTLYNIGNIFYFIENYKMSEHYLKKSLVIQKEIGLKEISLKTLIFSALSYKQLGKDYDANEIHNLIKDAENIEFALNLRLYELLDNKSFLETAYNQVQEEVNKMEKELGQKFLSYPIPKVIIEEYNKVFKN